VFSPSNHALFRKGLRYSIEIQFVSFPQRTFKLPSPELPYFSQACWNRTELRTRATAEAFRANPCINWDAILYSQISWPIYITQVAIALISYIEALLILAVSYKGRLRQYVFRISFLMDTIISLGQICTVSRDFSGNIYVFNGNVSI